MGLFNYVNHRMPCPTCGQMLTDFQTKDGDDLYMHTVEPFTVSNFYALCHQCRTWVEYNRKPAASLADYDMKVETPKGAK